MASMLFALPLKAGQMQAAHTFAEECLGPRFAEYQASEQRIGIQEENWYLQHNATGEWFTIYVEGPDLM